MSYFDRNRVSREPVSEIKAQSNAHNADRLNRLPAGPASSTTGGSTPTQSSTPNSGAGSAKPAQSND